MRRNDDLEARLKEWGTEYGGGRYEEIGWQGASPLAVMMKYHGRAPDGLTQSTRTDRTPADEVHEAVEALGRQVEGWLPAQVIRIEYWLPGQPVEAKLQKLRRVGSQVSRVRYYQLLRLARIYVAGRLQVAFSEEVDGAAA